MRYAEDIKQGRSFEYIKDSGDGTVDDAYRSIAACAVFQACKDYKAWLVARHFLATKLPELKRNAKVASLLYDLGDSQRKYIWRSVGSKADRERICLDRILRIIEHEDISRFEPMFTKIRAFAEAGGTLSFHDIGRQLFVIKSLAYKVLNAALDVMEGRTERFWGLKGFFQSPQFYLLSGGMDGNMIQREIERQAEEKIRAKEARGLPFSYDPEEEGEDEDYPV